jgi:hypothetical protein
MTFGILMVAITGMLAFLVQLLVILGNFALVLPAVVFVRPPAHTDANVTVAVFILGGYRVVRRSPIRRWCGILQKVAVVLVNDALSMPQTLPDV